MTDNKKISDMPLEIRAEEAMRKAVANVIADHKRTGDPIVIWRNGKAVKIPALLNLKARYGWLYYILVAISSQIRSIPIFIFLRANAP